MYNSAKESRASSKLTIIVFFLLPDLIYGLDALVPQVEMDLMGLVVMPTDLVVGFLGAKDFYFIVLLCTPSVRPPTWKSLPKSLNSCVPLNFHLLSLLL